MCFWFWAEIRLRFFFLDGREPVSFEKNATVTCIVGYEGYLNSSYNLVREFSAQNLGFKMHWFPTMYRVEGVVGVHYFETFPYIGSQTKQQWHDVQAIRLSCKMVQEQFYKQKWESIRSAQAHLWQNHERNGTGCLEWLWLFSLP